MLTDTAIREASRLLNEVVTAGRHPDLPREVQNPFQHTDAQRRAVLSLLRQWQQTGKLGTDLTGADVETLASLLVGMGPLDPLIQDPAVISINVLAHNQILVQRGGAWEPARLDGQPVGWSTPEALHYFAEALAARAGQALEDHPVVQAHFAHPVSGRLQIDATARTPAGVTLHLRLGRRSLITLARMRADGGISPEIQDFLIELGRRDCGVIVVGPPNTGKTTILEACLEYWPPLAAAALDDRSEFFPRHPLITVYDVPPERLRLAFVDVLRKNLTRVALAEVRGDEAAEMLRYSGALTIWTTLHGSIHNAVLRLMALVLGAPDSPYAGLPPELVRQVIAQAFPVLIETDKLVVGGRAIFLVSQIAVLDENGTPQPVFRAQLDGPTLKGFETVRDSGEVLRAFPRRTWGGVALPQPATLAQLAQTAPAAALPALGEYLRLAPDQARIRTQLKRLATQSPAIRRLVQSGLQAYRDQIGAALARRDWAELVQLYARLEADPIASDLAADAADATTGLRPCSSAELARRATLAAEAAEILATAHAPRHLLALAGLWERVQAEPEIYPEGTAEQVLTRLQTVRGAAGPEAPLHLQEVQNV